MPGRPLTPEQNECVRAHLRQLLKQYGTQKKLAAKLGVTQPSVSAFLSGRQGASYFLVERVAAMRGLEEREVLGKMPGKGLVLPKGVEAARELAAELARQDHIHEEAIDSVFEEPLPADSEARSILWWTDRMRWRERELLAQLRGAPSEAGELTAPRRRAKG